MSEAFKKAQVTWWMDYGTLLGAVRNPLIGHPPGLIPHDKDGDIGFLGDQWDALKDALGIGEGGVNKKLSHDKENVHYQWNGLLVIHKLPRPTRSRFSAGDSVKICLSDTNRINVDLFPWYNLRPGILERKTYVGVDRFKGREFPENRLFPLRQLRYEQFMFPAPNESEWFCYHRYGENWMKPLYRNNEGKTR
jgi:phosphorylcholine metabolism protein LicD